MSEQTQAVLSVAVAAPTVSEALVVTVDAVPVEARELAGDLGGRFHVVDLPPGPVVITYDAALEPADGTREVTELDRLRALRPSRYCPSDLVGPLLFADLRDDRSPERVTAWVRERLVYDGTASRPVDSALDTLLSGRGVCRDYAHLLISALRALDVPARLVAVYAPGLWPMDFHAVVEVAVDGTWQLFDATGLAPRQAMVRIGTGLDAAGTAFLTLIGGAAQLTGTEVWAWTDDEHLPVDGPRALP